MTISFGNLELNLGASPHPAGAVPQDDQPFFIAIFGDFTGRRNRGLADPKQLAQCAPIFIDRDNFEEVLESLSPQLRLRLGSAPGSEQQLRFGELDDFHPDQVYDQLELFASLRATRRKLLNTSTFAEIAAELLPPPADSQQSPDAGTPPATPQLDANGAGLLDAALQATERDGQQPDTAAARMVDRLVRDVVAPHVIPAPDPRQQDLVASVDAATAEQMRQVLHARDFQALESAWRGLYFLVRRLETSVRLKLFLVDVSKDELAADLTGTDDLSRSGFYQQCVDQGPAPGHTWSLLLSDFSFGNDDADVDLLGRISKVAARAGAAFLAGAEAGVVGCDAMERCADADSWTPPGGARGEAWMSLRRLPSARYVCLALPRFLLRLPYGAKTSPIDSFEFSEAADVPRHQQYLWGNPAWLSGYLVGDSFVEHGWQLDPGRHVQVGNLPLHVFQHDGEATVQPCAEMSLAEQGAEKIRAQGVTPVFAVRDSDSIQIPGLQSVADPPAGLAGGWSG